MLDMSISISISTDIHIEYIYMDVSVCVLCLQKYEVMYVVELVVYSSFQYLT